MNETFLKSDKLSVAIRFLTRFCKYSMLLGLAIWLHSIKYDVNAHCIDISPWENGISIWHCIRPSTKVEDIDIWNNYNYEYIDISSQNVEMPGDCCYTWYPPEIHPKIKSREITFTHKFYSYIVVRFKRPFLLQQPQTRFREKTNYHYIFQKQGNNVIRTKQMTMAIPDIVSGGNQVSAW